MIRRDDRNAAGELRWTLISQIDHARLASELAEHWGAGPVAPPEPRAEILSAILHHDDGWAERDASPLFDVTTGRVLDFMEMPLDESLAIWRASIEASATFGPLQAYAVSGHFCTLLERSIAHHRDDVQRCELAGTFLAEQRNLQAECLTAWQQFDTRQRTLVKARRVLGWLQMFDWLSLWLCCTPRSEPERVAVPDGPTVTLEPVSTNEMAVFPWPWQVERLKLTVAGRAVPVGHYTSVAELAAADLGAVTLTWLLRPA